MFTFRGKPVTFVMCCLYEGGGPTSYGDTGGEEAIDDEDEMSLLLAMTLWR